MNIAPQTVDHPLHTRHAEGDRLGAEITELCSYIYAATYQLLVKIREFDENEYRAVGGVCSCAHWLNFKCGIGMNAAREKVRVAHALAKLPLICEAFRKGQVSYSKVRAMTRIADESNEDYLLMIANHWTAHHVEKLVSQYRRCNRLQDLDNAKEVHKNRELHYFHDEDGSLVIKARFPAEQGALILKAIDMAIEAQEADVTAETSRRIARNASGAAVQGQGLPLSGVYQYEICRWASHQALGGRWRNQPGKPRATVPAPSPPGARGRLRL